MLAANDFRRFELPPAYDSIGQSPIAQNNPLPSCPPTPSAPPAQYHQPLDFDVTEEEIEQTLTLEQRFINVIKRYNITRYFSDRLQKHLFSTKLVLVCDDSTNMTEEQFQNSRHFMRAAIEIATVFNPAGVDVFFVRRPTARQVTCMNDLEPYLLSEPLDETVSTLAAVVLQVLTENKKSRMGEFGLHVTVLGGVEPVDEMGASDMRVFMNTMELREKHVYTTWVVLPNRPDAQNKWTTVAFPQRFMLSQHAIFDKRFQAIQSKRSLGDYVSLNLIGVLNDDIMNVDPKMTKSRSCSQKQMASMVENAGLSRCTCNIL